MQKLKQTSSFKTPERKEKKKKKKNHWKYGKQSKFSKKCNGGRRGGSLVILVIAVEKRSRFYVAKFTGILKIDFIRIFCGH